MAIDIYKLEDRNRRSLLYSFEPSEYDGIERIFSKLNSLTGIYIDPYSTTRLYSDHIKILSRLMDDNKELKIDSTFKTLMSEMVKLKATIVFEGD